MTPTKFLIGQIAIVFTVVILGVWFATQWTAWHLGYQPRLGPHWFVLFSVPIYDPGVCSSGGMRIDAYAPALFNHAGMIAASSGFAGIGVAIVGSLWRARQNKLVTTYGSSRWARHRRSPARVRFVRRASFSVDWQISICAMTGRSMSWPLRRPARARASVWSFRRCSPGPAAPSFTTSRARTGN